MTDPTTPLPTPLTNVNRSLPELLRELAERAGDDGRVTVHVDFLDALADEFEAKRPYSIEIMPLEQALESAVEANGDPDDRVWNFMPDTMAQYAQRFGVENDERALRASPDFRRYATHVAIECDWLIDAFVAGTHFAVTSEGHIAYW